MARDTGSVTAVGFIILRSSMYSPCRKDRRIARAVSWCCGCKIAAGPAGLSRMEHAISAPFAQDGLSTDSFRRAIALAGRHREAKRKKKANRERRRRHAGSSLLEETDEDSETDSTTSSTERSMN
ncbi:hypothetical protein Y032_0126g1322 [Ancylostoma ceylanicum]|nr:hypothetical protein Y032_0126g1322 [Ancylostoma ceylanicum]